MFHLPIPSHRLILCGCGIPIRPNRWLMYNIITPSEVVPELNILLLSPRMH